MAALNEQGLQENISKLYQKRNTLDEETNESCVTLNENLKLVRTQTAQLKVKMKEMDKKIIEIQQQRSALVGEWRDGQSNLCDAKSDVDKLKSELRRAQQIFDQKGKIQTQRLQSIDQSQMAQNVLANES